MHIVFVGNHYKKDVASLKEWVEKSYSMHEVYKVLIEQGHNITVVQRFPTKAKQPVKEIYEGVPYVLVDDNKTNNLPARKYSSKVIQTVKGLKPDVVHSHNLRQLVQNYLIARKVNAPLVVQNHAELPFQKSNKLKFFYKPISAFLFSAPEQSDVWLEYGLLRRGQCQFVLEGSSHVKYMPQLDHRASSEQLCFLWTGNLNDNKDPLLILSGLERIFANLSNAKLYMAYRNTELMKKVKLKIESSDVLRDSVELLGELSQDEIGEYFHRCHFFVQGSHHEGSGYSAIEAIAAGVVPIITNIPSFKMITSNGTIGRLFEPGSIDGFVKGVNEVLKKDWKNESQKARQHFNENLSFNKIAEDLISIYKNVTKRD